MSIVTMILGESGTGKSTSIRNLDPDKTGIIQVTKKPLPFRDSNKFKVFCTDDYKKIIAAINKKSNSNVLVIDDFQYVMSNEFMRRSDQKGFDKFTEIGRHAWDILTEAVQADDNKRIYILSHTETGDNGKTKIKTIGKMLDDKITLEGMVSIVLKTTVVNGQYFFTTQNNGNDTVKSPMGMFEDELIENDLALVDKAITNYYGIGA